jgi:putative ABC transport system permease protein
VRRLSSLGSKNLAHRKGRSILTGTGIVLGVAILFGVLVANATTQKGVDDLISSFTGRSDVVAGPIGAFDAKLPPGTVERLRSLPQVADVVGEYGFDTALRGYPSKSDPKEPTNLAISGIVPAESQKIRDYPFTAGRFPHPGALEIDISKKLADDFDLKVGNTLPIRGRKLARTFTIVGIVDVKDVGGFRNGGGGRGFVATDVARKMQGDPSGTFDGADIVLTKGVDADTWLDAHKNAVTGVRMQNAQNLAAGFKQFLSAFGIFLAFFAAIVLFIGAFLIYLTLSMAVIERTRIYGTLRALGATSKQVRRVVLLEAISLGVISTIVGLIVGLGLARGLLVFISKLFGLSIPGLQITPGALIATVLVGLVVTLVSAMIPARRAGKLAPIVAMKGDYVRDTKLSRSWIAGAIISVFGIALSLGNANLGPLGAIVILLGAVLLVPLVLRPLSRLLGRLTHNIARGVGDIAVLHLAKERSRSAYTLALIMIVMAMLFATGGLYLSLRSGINQIVDRQFGADMFVQPRTPDDGTVGARLTKVPGVAEVTPLRFGFGTGVDTKGKTQNFFIRTIDPSSYFAVSSYFWKAGQGSDAAAENALMRGGAIIASDEVAKTLGAKVGDTVTINTARGPHQFSLAAIYIGVAGPPEMTMGVKDARTYLSASRPQAYALNVTKGSSPDTVATTIKHDLSAFQPETQTSAQAKDEARSQIATYFQIVWAILLIAAIVGLLGLANTLAMSVLQRFREIGILRAIGVTRSQTWRMVLVEASTLGLTAFVLSIPLGALMTYLVVRATSSGFGFTISTLYPWVWVPFVALFAAVIAVIGSIAPGRRASRLEVVSALQYE